MQNSYRTYLNFSLLVSLALWVGVFVAYCRQVQAQEKGSLALTANRLAVHPLTVDRPAASEWFQVDSASDLVVDILSSVGDLETSIIGPLGQVVNSETVAGFGGTFSAVEVQGQDASPHLLGTPAMGFSHRYQFPSLGPGQYIVQFAATQPLLQDEAVLVDVRTDSPVRVALLATQGELTLGDPAVLSAAVFDGDNPVAGAAIEVALLDEADQLSTLHLLDDGGTYDEVAGDGLYSGSFEPVSPGMYRVAAEITGFTHDHFEFHRQATTRFRVIQPLGWLRGTYSDQLVDDNGNNRPDRLVIRFDADIIVAGSYAVRVQIQTPAGKVLGAAARAELAAGVQQISVSYQAQDLRETGEDGPYTVYQVQLIHYGPEATDADRMTHLGPTRAFRIADLERPGLILLGVLREQPLDQDLNGLVDHLSLTLGIDSLHDGVYSWNATLRDRNFKQISRRKWAQRLSRGLNELEIVFDTTRIGLLRTDGPYQVPDLVVYHSESHSPAFGSIMVERPLQTEPYQAAQFETAQTVPVTAKPNGEGHVKPGPGHLLTVAVLADETYDITTVNPWAFRMGPLDAGEAHREAHWKDFDRDGDLDLVLHFDAFAAQIQCGQEVAHVVGQFFDGRYLGGSTPIRTTGCR